MTANRNYLFWLLLLLGAAGNIYLLSSNPLNNDVSWYLHVGQEMLAGKRLYVDVIETNPPLICYLTTLPVLLAHVLGTDIKLTWIVLATALVCLLCAGSAILWSRARAARGFELVLTLLFLLATSLAFLFSLDFGQRDHLAYVASVTAVGLIACRIAGVRVNAGVAVGVGAVAGLLLALKPFFLFPWLLCLIYSIRLLGWKAVVRYPETYVVPLMSFSQIGLTLFVCPAFLEVARQVARWYSTYNSLSWLALLREHLLFAGLAATAVTFLYSAAAPTSRRVIRLAGLCAAGWVLSGIAQRKGWHYHVLPSLAAAGFTMFLIALDFARRTEARRYSRVAMQFAALILVAFAGLRTARLHWDFGPTTELTPVVRRQGAGSSMITLSTGMFEFPLVNETRAKFEAHYNSLWLLPGLYADQVNKNAAVDWVPRRPEQMGADEKNMVDLVYSDLERRPTLVIIDAGQQMQGMGLLHTDLKAYLEQDSRIRDLLAQYEPVPFDGNYRVLRRISVAQR